MQTELWRQENVSSTSVIHSVDADESYVAENPGRGEQDGVADADGFPARLPYRVVCSMIWYAQLGCLAIGRFTSFDATCEW